MSISDKIFSEISHLNVTEKLQLVDEILSSINPVNKGVEALWEEEAEERVTAYDEGRVSTHSEEEVLKKYGTTS